MISILQDQYSLPPILDVHPLSGNFRRRRNMGISNVYAQENVYVLVILGAGVFDQFGFSISSLNLAFHALILNWYSNLISKVTFHPLRVPM